MGNLRQSMTREEWDELGKQSSEKKQSFRRYTIDTKFKTITIEQGNVNELIDLLTKLKTVYPDIHVYDVVSKTTTIPVSVRNGNIENYVSTITTKPKGTKPAESKL